MRIDILPKGTKLIWEPGSTYPGTDKPIIYPALVGEKHRLYYSSDAHKLVRIHLPNSTQFMGPIEDHLREPYQDELDYYKWPEI
jgi:hypothetical protein